jgi:hypothetical protein
LQCGRPAACAAPERQSCRNREDEHAEALAYTADHYRCNRVVRVFLDYLRGAAVKPARHAMKTRIVLTFDELEFAALCGAASAWDLPCKDFIMKILRQCNPRALSSLHDRMPKNLPRTTTMTNLTTS